MAVDITPVLNEVSTLLLGSLRSDDPRRFSIVHRVSRCALKLVQAVSVRVEDFEDSPPMKRGLGYFKGMNANTPQVLVPPNLERSAADVLEAMTRALITALESGTQRFAEIERITDCALHFIASITPPRRSGKGREPSENDMVSIIACEDPEGDYVRDSLERAPVDTNQLRREILEIEGTDSQVRVELALAKIAREEAAELDHLLSIQKSGAPDLRVPTMERIGQLRNKLIFRTKGTHGVVSANVLRGHQPRGEGARDDDPQGQPHDSGRAQGSRIPSQEGAGEALRMFTLGDA